MPKLRWIALAVAALPLQGFLVFSLWGKGNFLSPSGAKFTLGCLAVDLVIGVVAAMHYERLHSGAVANPHSLIGQTLRRDAVQPPAPPPTREAWDGGWEDPDKASDKMSRKH